MAESRAERRSKARAAVREMSQEELDRLAELSELKKDVAFMKTELAAAAQIVGGHEAVLRTVVNALVEKRIIVLQQVSKGGVHVPGSGDVKDLSKTQIEVVKG